MSAQPFDEAVLGMDFSGIKDEMKVISYAMRGNGVAGSGAAWSMVKAYIEKLEWMTQQPHAGIALEWKRGVAHYNTDICAVVRKETNRVTWQGNVQICNRIVDLQVGFENEIEAQKWCANTIQSITTQTPQL